jgi:hypothetical protein
MLLSCYIALSAVVIWQELSVCSERFIVTQWYSNLPYFPWQITTFVWQIRSEFSINGQLKIENQLLENLMLRPL